METNKQTIKENWYLVRKVYMSGEGSMTRQLLWWREAFNRVEDTMFKNGKVLCMNLYETLSPTVM